MTDEPSGEEMRQAITGFCFSHGYYVEEKCPACSEYLGFLDAQNDMAEAAQTSYVPPEGFQLVDQQALLRLVNAVDELVGAMCDLIPPEE